MVEKRVEVYKNEQWEEVPSIGELKRGEVFRLFYDDELYVTPDNETVFELNEDGHYSDDGRGAAECYPYKDLDHYFAWRFLEEEKNED